MGIDTPQNRFAFIFVVFYKWLLLQFSWRIWTLRYWRKYTSIYIWKKIINSTKRWFQFAKKLACISNNLIFRAQELKAPMTYCDHALSVVHRPSVRQLTFSTSSLKPLDGFWWSTHGSSQVLVFSAESAQGRIQGGTKIGHKGSLLQRTSSSDR